MRHSWLSSARKVTKQRLWSEATLGIYGLFWFWGEVTTGHKVNFAAAILFDIVDELDGDGMVVWRGLGIGP